MVFLTARALSKSNLWVFLVGPARCDIQSSPWAVEVLSCSQPYIMSYSFLMGPSFPRHDTVTQLHYYRYGSQTHPGTICPSDPSTPNSISNLWIYLCCMLVHGFIGSVDVRHSCNVRIVTKRWSSRHLKMDLHIVETHSFENQSKWA